MIDIATVSWGDLGWIVLAFGISMWLLTSALTGYEKNRLILGERVARGAVGFAILVPNMTIALPSLLLAVALIIGHRFLKGEPSPIDVAAE